MSIYMSVDPGQRSGVCVASYEGMQSISEMLLLATIYEDKLKNELKFLLKKYEPIVVVVESSPMYGDADQLVRVQNVIDLAKEFDPEIRVVVLAPGNWKPIAKANNWKHPRAKNEHENDACCLLKYFLITEDNKKKEK